MAITYTLQAISDGEQGIRETLRIMSKVIKEYRKSPTIRELALKLTRGLPPKKWLAEANAIHEFVRDHIRYIKDIRGCETIQTPIQTLRIAQGDCDDKSTLVCALLESIGHPTRLVAMGFAEKGRYSHVLPQTKIGGKWVTLETTEPWPLGKHPKNAKSIMTQHN